MNKTLLLTGASAFALMLAVSAPAYAADGAKASATGDSTGNVAIDDESQRENSTVNAWNDGATGIVHNQQNNGNNNAINAATAVHADVTGETPLETGAVASSTSDDNASEHFGDHDLDRDNHLVDTMNGFVGSATHQQNNGNGNAMNAATALDGVSGDTRWIDQNADADASSSYQTGDDADFVVDDDSLRGNLIENTLNPAAGVYTVQQNNGNGNAMSASTAAAGVTGGTAPIDQFATAQSSTNDNDLDQLSGERTNNIENALNSAIGVTTVQQNNGDANAMSASTAVIGTGSAASTLSQHALSGTIASGTKGNQSGQLGGLRDNRIDPAYNSYEGIATVQQNNGNGNAMESSTAVGAIMGSTRRLLQVSGSGKVWSGTKENVTDDFETDRTNTIDNSFRHADGVLTVQQNNGDANRVSSATAVTGNVGGEAKQAVIAGKYFTGTGWNDVYSEVADRDNYISDMHGIDGVTTVQQNNGDANNMAAANAVAAMNNAGSVDQSVKVPNWSAFNETDDLDSDRLNDIDTALHGYDGVLSVQQNNGSANSIAVGNAVVAAMGDTGSVDQEVKAKGKLMEINADDDASVRLNKIENSFHGFDGVLTVQQNNGDANSMNVANGFVAVMGEAGNATQVVDADGFADGTDHINFDHGTGKEGNPLPHRDNDIDPSFNNVTGLVNVQQNNGNGNSMNVANAALVTLDGGENTDQTVMAGGESEHNNTIDFHSARTNAISDGSFDNFTGVATIQQNNGDSNVMSAAVGVVANINTVKRFGEGGAVADSGGDATVDGNGAISTSFSDRLNMITDTMTGVKGVITLQQNNGDNNVVGAATDVVATTGEPGFGPAASTATLSATVANNFNLNTGTVGAPGFSNELTGSFSGASGVMTVQQNNGNNNAIQSAVSVIANGISFDFN